MLNEQQWRFFGGHVLKGYYSQIGRKTDENLTITYIYQLWSKRETESLKPSKKALCMYRQMPLGPEHTQCRVIA